MRSFQIGHGETRRRGGEEGDGGVSAGSGAAFENLFAAADVSAGDMILLSPFALKRGETRRFSAREAPCRGKQVFKADCFSSAVYEFRVADDEIGFGNKFVVEFEREIKRLVGQGENEMIVVFENVVFIDQLQRTVG